MEVLFGGDNLMTYVELPSLNVFSSILVRNDND